LVLSVDRSTAASNAFSPSVSIVTRPLWRLRLMRAAPRYLLYATCFAGLLASARFALDPPRPHAAAARAPGFEPPDLAAEGYASLFARRFLTWEAARPQASAQPLTAMAGSAIDPDAGLSLPATGAQHVSWAEVVQARSLPNGRHVYTVAAQTDVSGLVYLTVGVTRQADGQLALSGYPAFVGAPASAPAVAPAHLPEVTNPALAVVAERALRNYLGASSGELAADLSSTARVSVPSLGLTLDAMQRLTWTTEQRSVLAVVEASDGRGVRYTLAYELDVTEVGGRWEVSAIQMDPDS
jgi:hypothetical protein